MAIDIEHLLWLTADYHNFCNDNFVECNAANQSDELSEDELDLIAAAADLFVNDIENIEDGKIKF